MSGVSSADEYHPGLEGVIASETAIANIEGPKGPAGWNIEDTGSRIWRVTSRTRKRRSCSCTATCPRRSQFSEFDAGSAAAGRYRSRSSPSTVKIPKHIHPMDVLAHVGERAGPFRSRSMAPTHGPCSQRSQGRALIAQMATAVAFRDRIATGLPLSMPRRRPRSCRQFPEHGQRQGSFANDARGVRPLAGAVRRARTQRLYILGQSDGLDAL